MGATIQDTEAMPFNGHQKRPEASEKGQKSDR